jgi:N-acetylglutamate synthase
MKGVDSRLVHIRSYATDDYLAVIDLWRACGVQIEPEDDAASLDRLCANPLGKGDVAVADGHVVGAALCGSDGRFGYIHHLAVHPEWRRQGIGAALLERCKQFLFSEIQLNTVAVFVWQDNPHGQRFWKESGFERADGLDVLVLRS